MAETATVAATLLLRVVPVTRSGAFTKRADANLSGSALADTGLGAGPSPVGSALPVLDFAGGAAPDQTATGSIVFATPQSLRWRFLSGYARTAVRNVLADNGAGPDVGPECVAVPATYVDGAAIRGQRAHALLRDAMSPWRSPASVPPSMSSARAQQAGSR